MGLDDAIEALVEREVAKRMERYNDHILKAMLRADEGADPNIRRFPLREWFRIHVMENT